MIEDMEIALIVVGFVIGLGAVTVIDVHGFLASVLRSGYWTEATVRAHRVTKPLIWLGTLLYGAGLLLARDSGIVTVGTLQLLALAVMVANGLFLTFHVSRFLLRREREGRASELLPMRLQAAIALSFAVSVIGWWGSLALFVVDLATRLS